MSAIDAINYRYGRDTLQMASECKVGNWKQKEKTAQETIQRRLIDCSSLNFYLEVSKYIIEFINNKSTATVTTCKNKTFSPWN